MGALQRRRFRLQAQAPPHRPSAAGRGRRNGGGQPSERAEEKNPTQAQIEVRERDSSLGIIVEHLARTATTHHSPL